MSNSTAFDKHRRARVALGAAILLALFAAFAGCDRLGKQSEAEMLQHAKELHGKGQPEAAATQLKTLLQNYPANAEGRYLLGEVSVVLKLGGSAESELKRAVELGIPRDSVQIALGQALLLQRSYDRALKEIVLPENPSDTYRARILEIQGRALIGLGRYREGCDLVKRSAALDSSYVRTYWGLALCAVGFRKFDEARAHLDAAVKLEPANSETWTRMGDIARLERRLEDSDKAYATALKYAPRNVDALLGRAEARIIANRLKDAEEDIKAVLAVAKSQPIAYHLRGVIQFKRGEYRDAKTTFETVLRTKIYYPLTYQWLGLTEFVLGNYESAGRAFQIYLQSRPENAVDVYAALAYLDASTAGKDSAEERLKVLRKFDIDSAMALNFIGNAYLRLGQSEAAVEYLQRAVEARQQVDSYVNLASAYSSKGETERALEALEKAVSLQPPGTNQVEMTLIRTLIAGKQHERALKAIDTLEQKNPKSATPHVLRGQVRLAQKDEAGARAEFAKAMEASPGEITAGNTLALLDGRQKKFDAARGHLLAVLKRHKDELTTLLALYGLEVGANRPAEAQGVLDRAAAAYPTATTPAALLGERYLNSGRALKAMEVTQAAAAANPNDQPLLVLRGRAYLELGDPTDALTAYKQLVRLQPKSADAVYYTAVAYALAGERPQYRAALGDTLKLNPRHLLAKVALARLELQEGKPDAAYRIARELRKEHPDAADAASVESEALMAKGSRREAVAALEQFQKAHPQDSAARELLVKSYLYAGDKESALRVAREGRSAHPDRPEALELLAQTLLRTGDSAGALAVYQEALKSRPNSAQPHVSVGLVHVATGNYAAARPAFQNALRLDAENLDAQRALASLDAREKRYDAALEIARQVQRQRPSSAAGFVLEGDLLAAQKKFALAARSYESALRFEPTSLVFMKLYDALLESNAQGDADRRAAEWLRERPHDLDARRHLGQTLLLRGRNREAIEQYQALLKRSDADILALNNLAILYQRERDPRALETAERAYKLRPDSPVTLDTLGWLLIEKGTLPRGLDLLRQARKLAPQSTEIAYHYAEALAKTGDKAQARSELESLLKSGKEFADKAAAQKLLGSL